MKKEIVDKILQQNREIYNTIAPIFFNTRKKPWPVLDTFKKYSAEANAILDLGCGSGRLADLFINSEKKYLGIDSSEKLIQIAKNNYHKHQNIKFQFGDILELNLSKQKNDLVFLVAVLHHIPTLELQLKVLKNINTSLKNDGHLIISNWNLWQPQYRKYLFNYKVKFLQNKVLNIKDTFIPWKLPNKWQWRYIHSFSKSELKNILNQSGFEIEKIYYEYKGQETSFLNGRNIVAIASKK